MATWWWVRHGPTGRKEFNGWTDVPAILTDADLLARLAAYLPADALVVSSDLQRAAATADAIASGRPRLPHDPGLREISFGDWEGRPYAEIGREYPDLARRYFSDPSQTAPPGGERWDALADRVGAAVARLDGLAEHIVAVAHFGTILTQVQRARGCDTPSVLAQPIDYLSVTRIEAGPRWAMHEVNHRP